MLQILITTYVRSQPEAEHHTPHDQSFVTEEPRCTNIDQPVRQEHQIGSRIHKTSLFIIERSQRSQSSSISLQKWGFGEKTTNQGCHGMLQLYAAIAKSC